MAPKKSRPKKTKKSVPKKHYPVVRGSFLGSVAENAAVRIFDTARGLSVLNRRLYRYARVYPVNISMIPTATQNVEVFALRDDWAVHQGLKMAYQQYLKNTADERKNLGTQVARWEDFRVADGVAAVSNTLLPKLHDPTFTGTGSILSAGEFALSNVVDQANVKRTFTWGTPGGGSYGILQEYDKSGNAQGDPSAPTLDAPYVDIDSEVNEGTHDDLQADGNLPPYDQSGVNAGSPWVKIGTLGAGVAGQQRLSTGFFNAPCGLVVLVGNSNDWNSDEMMFEVQKGDYKGVGGKSLLE
jgi:hypothetical protein